MFPALKRLEEKGWVLPAWGESENGRRAKFYKLAPAGRRQLRDELENWQRIATAIGWAIEATK
jgi:DNA-binding PadR family transcriptional regulator